MNYGRMTELLNDKNVTIVDLKSEFICSDHENQHSIIGQANGNNRTMKLLKELRKEKNVLMFGIVKRGELEK